MTCDVKTRSYQYSMSDPYADGNGPKILPMLNPYADGK